MPTIDILTPGKAVGTTSGGGAVTLVITDEIMRDVVETYNPSHFKPPLIISHNTQGVADADLAESELAHGYPTALELIGGRVKAFVDNASEQVTNWFRGGQLLNVSPSLYPPEHPSNPYPGKWSLRHIAALGKSPPAIKGLQVSFEEALCFSSDVEGVIDLPYSQILPTEEPVKAPQAPVDFGEGYAYATFLQRFREFLLTRFDQEAADTVVPIDMLTEAMSEAATEEVEYAPMSSVAALQSQMDELYGGYADFMKYKEYKNMSEGTQTPDASELQALRDLVSQLQAEKNSLTADFSEQTSRLDRLYAAVEAQREQLDRERRQLEEDKVVNFVEGLVQSQKVLAAKKSRVVTQLLAADNTTALDFGEGQQMTHRASLMADLSAQDVLPEFKNFKSNGNPAPAPRQFMSFSLPADVEIDMQAASELARAEAYMQEHPSASLSEALRNTRG